MPTIGAEESRFLSLEYFLGRLQKYNYDLSSMRDIEKNTKVRPLTEVH